MSESKGRKNRVAAADRQRRALELRAAGAGFASIARQLGYAGPSGAFKAVSAGLNATLQEPADELRTLELDRLDQLLAAVWPLALQGDFQAIDRALKIGERRARLMGIDAPRRVDIEQRIRVLAEQLGLDADGAVEEAARIIRDGRGR
jgi:hypothetical protein